jgi:hypothetical protein
MSVTPDVEALQTKEEYRSRFIKYSVDDAGKLFNCIATVLSNLLHF